MTITIAGLELAPESVVAKLLQIDMLQWLGKYSYSIYLWHYPVIVISRLTGLLPDIQIYNVIGIIGVIFILSRLSWILVEQPVRNLSWYHKQVIFGWIGVTIMSRLFLITFCKIQPKQQAHASPEFEYPYFSGYAEETGEGAGLGYNFNFPSLLMQIMKRIMCQRSTK
jgi:hypothetical protein